MLRVRVMLIAASLAVLALACGSRMAEPPTMPPSTSEPSATPPTTPLVTAPVSASATPTQHTAERRPCELVVETELTAYQRPSLEAQVFAAVPAGLRAYVEAVTADGWVGFDPGFAQAGNVGLFRLRWVQQTEMVSLEGDCHTLPVVKGPPAGVCFVMCMLDTPVFAAADTSSSVIVTMQHGDYAKVLATSEGWVQVDLSVGSLERDRRGWIKQEVASFNGPCQDLPTVTP